MLCDLAGVLETGVLSQVFPTVSEGNWPAGNDYLEFRSDVRRSILIESLLPRKFAFETTFNIFTTHGPQTILATTNTCSPGVARVIPAFHLAPTK